MTDTDSGVPASRHALLWAAPAARANPTPTKSTVPDLARALDDGTNDLLVSNVIRTNEMQVWFVAEHVVDVPLVHANGQSAD